MIGGTTRKVVMEVNTERVFKHTARYMQAIMVLSTFGVGRAFTSSPVSNALILDNDGGQPTMFLFCSSDDSKKKP